MFKNFLIFISLFSAMNIMADTIKVNEEEITFKIRESNYNPNFDKLNLTIEVQLVNGRLPTEIEMAAISSQVLKNQPKARRLWVFYLLPKMKSGAGAYATDHRAPTPEGVKILSYMLYNTPYQDLLK